jgi:hypothetical protein
VDVLKKRKLKDGLTEEEVEEYRATFNRYNSRVLDSLRFEDFKGQ